MFEDPIVTEIRKIREEYGAKFDHNLDAIFDDIKRRERASGRQYVRLPPRPSRRQSTTSAAQSER